MKQEYFFQKKTTKYLLSTQIHRIFKTEIDSDILDDFCSHLVNEGAGVATQNIILPRPSLYNMGHFSTNRK